MTLRSDNDLVGADIGGLAQDRLWDMTDQRANDVPTGLDALPPHLAQHALDELTRFLWRLEVEAPTPVHLSFSGVDDANPGATITSDRSSELHCRILLVRTADG